MANVYVPGPGPLAWTAEYLGPPIESPAPRAAEIAAGVRDAVILEVWEEAVSAYQAPLDLTQRDGATLRQRLVPR